MAAHLLKARSLLGILIIWLLSASLAAAPATMDSLMSAQLTNPSSNQQANFKKALAQVLVKATGNPSVTTLPMVRASFANVANMVKSYGTIADPSNPGKQLLEVTFNPKAIENVLTNAGQPMWDAARPKTLIWLAVANPNGSNTVLDSTAASTQPVAMRLIADANQRGLNAFYPLLDLSDESLIASNLKSTSPLTTADMQSLANRYHVQSVLAGVVTKVGNQWQAQWRYLLDSAPIDWSQDPDSAKNIATQTINTVASTMVAQLAISTTSNIQTKLYLEINQVSNLQSYGQLSQCLTKLSNMNSLSPVDLNDNQVTFLAQFNGSSDELIQTVSQKCNLTFQNNTNGVNPKNNLPSNLQNTSLPVLSFIDVGGQHV